MKAQLLALLAPVVLSAGISAQVLLSEDFAAGSLDPARWLAVTQGVPLGGTAVFVQGGECVLQNRGHLVTVQQFAQGANGGYKVRCKWRCADVGDIFCLLVRSDGVPSGSYGETSNGVGLDVWLTGAPTLLVRGSQIQLGPQTTTGPGLTFQAGLTYTAAVTDLGHKIVVRVEGPNPTAEWREIEASVLGDTTTVKRVVFHNREQTAGFHQTFVDDIVIGPVMQTGRTMRLLAPVVIGQSSGFVMDHPPSIAGNGFGFAMCSPTFPGAIPVSVPGVVEGVLRLTPLGYGVLGIGILDSSGTSAAFTFSLPNDPLLVGATFDVQGADVDGFGFMTLTDNDLEVVVGQFGPVGPPASLNMVPIAPGTFQMGSGAFALTPGHQWTAWELPIHTVSITQPFWMGKYEVTQAEYSAMMGSNPSYHQGAAYPNSASRPVEQATWHDAVAYCNSLTVQEAAAGRLPTGYEYRLPTEAEWEYCCRAGTTTEWNIGSAPGCGQANIIDVSTGQGCIGGTSVVGSYVANAWGLHDMHGNVWEWCLDSWDWSANYPAGAVSDPFVASGPVRIFRGGPWYSPAIDVRSAMRNGYDPNGVNWGFGFRVVCAPVLP